jgi:transposase
MLGPYRMSRRLVAEAMKDLFGIPMSVGAVIHAQERLSGALRLPVEEALESVKTAPVKYADETGWRIRGASAFLWTVVTSTLTVFLIQKRRTEEAARAILGVVSGVVTTDRHGAYNFWPNLERQFCWAHLVRAFRKIADRGGDSKVLGETLLGCVKKMFAWWHRVRDGTLARTTFRRYMKPLQDEVFGLLTNGDQAATSAKTRRTCRRLLKGFDAMWTFVYREGCEPTNNAAEQALRHAVVMRKVCYGSHSVSGARFTERILTCHATLRRQSRHILSFLTAACQAALDGTAPPSLLRSDAPALRFVA